MDSFDRAEEARERSEELAYEEHRARIHASLSESAEQEDDAYDLDDPKHETFHERYADVWDSREGK